MSVVTVWQRYGIACARLVSAMVQAGLEKVASVTLASLSTHTRSASANPAAPQTFLRVCLCRCPSCRGDQGFLNSYFEGFASAPVFDPGLDEASTAQLKYMRLPTRYNADIGLYVINGNKWSIPTSEIR